MDRFTPVLPGLPGLSEIFEDFSRLTHSLIRRRLTASSTCTAGWPILGRLMWALASTQKTTFPSQIARKGDTSFGRQAFKAFGSDRSFLKERDMKKDASVRKTVRVWVRLDRSTVRRLDSAAKTLKMNRSALVRSVLLHAIEASEEACR